MSKIFCCSGTLGCLLQSGGVNYILSNNHVLARTNLAAKGEDIVQPGLVDTMCGFEDDNIVGKLSAFVPINFAKRAVNYVDAAVATARSDVVDTSGWILNLGVVSSTVVAPTIGMPVQKSGRTTCLTTNGTVTNINYTVKVSYNKTCGLGSQTALFKGQMLIQGAGFSASGDSGSLIVDKSTTPNPVGLLFAGSNNYTVANPMSLVLQKLQNKTRKTFTVVGQASAGAAAGTEAPVEEPVQPSPRLGHLRAIKDRHEDAILSLPGVTAIGIGFSEKRQQPVLQISIEEDTPEVRKRLPKHLNGETVEIIRTGKFRAF